jgi:hypothetical protein
MDEEVVREVWNEHGIFWAWTINRARHLHVHRPTEET